MEDEVRGIKEILKKIATIKNPEERRKELELIFHIARLRPKRLDLLKREEILMSITIEVEKDPLYKEGLKKGFELKSKEATLNLYRELHLPVEKIAKVLKVPAEKVKQWLKEEGLI